jgi:pepF/M3 family oligoendopeptidase
MDVIIPGLQSPEFEQSFKQVSTGLDELEALFDQIGVDKRIETATESKDVADFEKVVAKYNAVTEDLRTLNAYVSAILTTDTRDEVALARDSEMDQPLTRLRKLGKRLTAWLGSLDVEMLLAQSDVAKAHAYALRKAVVGAQRLMSPAEESLASDMEVTGGSAWGKLHSNVTSQLIVALELDGEAQTLPMSSVRALAYDPDRDRRRSAYEAELMAWKTVEVPLAAAMNSIKGETITLAKRRGWGSPLEAALFGANIDGETLEAMMTAARESFPDFRRYLRAKAKALGLGRLSWYDIFAPVGEDPKEWPYDEATGFVVDQFRTYSDKLGDFARRSFHEDWIDVEPRAGKVDGAYCMGVRRDESRILMNYKPSFGAVSTLAHELGHAYHNLCLSQRTAMQRATPMTLAETASIFCETIIREAALQSGTEQEQLAILEASLQGSCQVVVDITSRFLFEQSVFDLRAKRELSAKELGERMRQAQLDTYGDGLDPEALHPYMWAAKPHYYGRSFYNFPYMFGLLFGLGLYAIYEKEPHGFHERYDDLLSSTGLDDAATLAQRFGIDIRTPDFWRGSLDQIRGDVDRFERLTSV